jgi:hypothetical protein
MDRAVNQISDTIPTDAPPQAQDQSPTAPPAGAAVATGPGDTQPDGFRSRGSARRRARFLRKARELAYRDLGGLVFNLHRFGARNDALVLAKLTTLTQIDTELRAIESALGERRAITVLREAGITACPRCAAIHGSEDGFCPNCGLSMGRHADLPIGVAAAVPASTGQPAAPTPTPPPQPSTSAAVQAPSPSPQPGAPAAAAPQTAPAPATAEPAPAAPAPAPSAGRSPTPPATFAATPAKEDGPTEILRPPVSGS